MSISTFKEGPRGDASHSSVANIGLITFCPSKGNQSTFRRISVWHLLALATLASAGQRPAIAQDAAHRPLVVGHRGLVQAAPENTLAAFRACLALCVGFEFDVRRTSDGKLVCLHDDTLDRTTDSRGPLASLTLAELQKLDAGSRFDPVFRGERIPRIAEIFKLLADESRGDVLIAVDLKEAGNGLEERLVQLAKEHKVLDRLLFIGLTIDSAEVRSRLCAADPATHVARLAAAPDEVTSVLSDKNSNWVYVRFLPTPADMTRIHAVGKKVFIAGPLVAGNESYLPKR
jgi:glycerophosphoryl diester phosphodiesterase